MTDASSSSFTLTRTASIWPKRFFEVAPASFRDRVLLVPRDTLRETDDQLALDRLRRSAAARPGASLRRRRRRRQFRDDERKRAQHVPKRIIIELRLFSTPERLGQPATGLVRAAAAVPPRPRLEPDPALAAELPNRVEDDPSGAVHPALEEVEHGDASGTARPCTSSVRTTASGLASVKAGTKATARPSTSNARASPSSIADTSCPRSARSSCRSSIMRRPSSVCRARETL